jgi:hypothetical protein
MSKLPATPPPGLLESMAMRYRHDFGLLKDEDDTSPMSCGMTPHEREHVLSLMAQLYEEVAGHGYFHWPT